MNIIGVSSVQTKLIQEVKCNTAYDQSVFFFLREKFFGTREKNRFSTLENQVVPVKISQKQPVKQKSFPWKISKNPTRET